MSTRTEQADSDNDLSNALRGWVMVALTLLFVLLYASALIGWLKPLADEKLIVRLEPVIFVIVGYYFGRLPSQQNENTIKGELNRQRQRAESAQLAKEQALQGQEALEEKVRNAIAALASATQSRISAFEAVGGVERPGEQVKEEALRRSVIATLSILNSK